MFLLIAAAVLSIAYAEQGEKDNDFLFQKTRFRNRQKYRESLKKTVEVEFSSIVFGCFPRSTTHWHIIGYDSSSYFYAAA